MYIKKITCLFFFVVFGTAFSQNGSVSGVLMDGNDKTPIYNSVVALLTPKDSILYRFTRSDSKGTFHLNKVKPGNYILMTSHRQYADYVDGISIEATNKNVGPLPLMSKINALREVVIKTGSIRIKGDTTSYRASDFKVDSNANVEELLKKLPGIQVDKNGVIKAMGETVQKVLVDGEEFFGDDPGMAVKNLRADAIKEVQVFDKKSDQAEFTGIDDGQKKKTINLKLKEDKKKGYFGKIDAANQPFAVNDSRYNTNVMFSSFKGKRKIAAFLLNGNTGQDGLNWKDRQQFGSMDDFSMNMDEDGNVNYEWTGDNNDNGPVPNTQDGFVKNTNAGLHYSNKWNGKHSLNFSPKFDNQLYTNHNSLSRKMQVGENQFNENSATTSHIDRSNLKMDANYEVQLDSLNTLKFVTKANFYNTKSDEFSEGQTTGNDQLLKNKQQKTYTTDGDKTSFFASVLYKHKFVKPRRTFSAKGSWKELNSSSNNFLKSFNQSYEGGSFLSSQDIDQNKNGQSENQNLAFNFTYSEPISKKTSLQFAYQITQNSGKSDYVTYDFSSLTGNYDRVVNELSNEFSQSIITNMPTMRLNYNSKKINYSVGSGIGFTTFALEDITFDKEYNRQYTNFFPSATFSYKYKNNGNISIRYRGETKQPTLNQLQPLRNNQNYFNQILGNPNLKQSFENSFSMYNNSYNILTETGFYQSISLRSTSNLITYNRDINIENAKTTSTPINTNGNFSGTLYLGYSCKIKKLKIDASINPYFGYTKVVNSINSILSNTKNVNSSLGIYLSKSKADCYDIKIENNFSTNRNSTSQNKIVKSFNTNDLSLEMGWYYQKNWKFSTDYNIYLRQKTDDFQTNLSNQMWNAKIKRTFMNDEFTAYVMVRDILNQNTGIYRTIYENTISEEKNDRLKRYAMIGVTWNFKNKEATIKK